MSHPNPLTVRLATCAKPELAVFLLFLLFVVFFIHSGKHLWRSASVASMAVLDECRGSKSKKPDPSVLEDNVL